jgi:hypothetical protein
MLYFKTALPLLTHSIRRVLIIPQDSMEVGYFIYTPVHPLDLTLCSIVAIPVYGPAVAETIRQRLTERIP